MISLCSFFFSSSSTFLLSSSFFSSSTFSSLCIRGRGSLVLPLTIMLVSPRVKSSLLSVLMMSCLKENPDMVWAFNDGAPAEALGNFCVSPVSSSSSVGKTFLTTRRATFTPFFWVGPGSSAESIELVQVLAGKPFPLVEPLTMLLQTVPFCPCWLLKPGSGYSGLLN